MNTDYATQNNSERKVIFEGDNLRSSLRTYESRPSKIVTWVIRKSKGYIKDEKQAQYIIFGFIIISMALPLFLFFKGKEDIKIKPSSTSVQQINSMPINNP